MKGISQLILRFAAIFFPLALASCSDRTASEIIENSKPLRELSEYSCPVHEVPVFKVPAAGEISCYSWDPKLGLTVEEIRQRFPYAIWDRNLHRTDNSPNAAFSEYNLLCDRCQASWIEYTSTYTPLKFEIIASPSGEILINGTKFSTEQVQVVAKVISNYQKNTRVHLRALKSTPVDSIKAVVEACRLGGLENVIFGTYTDEPDRDSKPSPEGRTK